MVAYKSLNALLIIKEYTIYSLTHQLWLIIDQHRLMPQSKFFNEVEKPNSHIITAYILIIMNHRKSDVDIDIKHKPIKWSWHESVSEGAALQYYCLFSW